MLRQGHGSGMVHGSIVVHGCCAAGHTYLTIHYAYTSPMLAAPPHLLHASLRRCPRALIQCGRGISVPFHFARTKSLLHGAHASKADFNDIFMAKTFRSNKAQSENDLVKCTAYNAKGEMVLHGMNIGKSAFLKRFDVAARDLRKLVRSHTSSASSSVGVPVDFVPLLVTRKDCILINLLNIRAIIKADFLVVFEYLSSSASSESYAHGTFLKELQRRLDASHPDALRLPYEFRALEAILVDVTTNLTTEANVHTTVVTNILASLDTSIERQKLRYLLVQLKKLAQFHQKAKLINDLLHDLLDQDDELNSLYLTEAAQGGSRKAHNHQEVELLLELYYATSYEIIQTTENLISQIKTSEEMIRFVLDANRNDLMLLGLRFLIGLLSMGIALYVAALYGMNLENFIEESDGGFEAVAVVGTVALVALFAYSARQLNALQKITMNKRHVRVSSSP